MRNHDQTENNASITINEIVCHDFSKGSFVANNWAVKLRFRTPCELLERQSFVLPRRQ